MNNPRRHFSGPEKVAMLNRHLLEKTPVSDLCDELNIEPNLFCGCGPWISPANVRRLHQEPGRQGNEM